jgi:hypothetical protein
MKTTPIGVISEGIDGSDHYVLVQRIDGDELTPDEARAWLLPRVYRECSAPGGRYCTEVNAVQAEYSERVVICTVQQRYDI